MPSHRSAASSCCDSTSGKRRASLAGRAITVAPLGQKRFRRCSKAERKWRSGWRLPLDPSSPPPPETLPQKDESGFKAGELIRHRVFGRGKILDLDGENLVARFDKGGTRKVRFTYVQKVA